jgi:hypothetical protein
VVEAMSEDNPFIRENNRARAKAVIDARKAVADETTKAAKQRMAERAKPKFNDLPQYKFRDPLKLGLG